MALNTMSLVTNLVVAERQGLPHNQALRLAVLGSLVGSPLVGVLITRQLAQREAASTTPVLVALPAPGAPTTTPPQTTPRKIKLESMIGRNKAEATTQLANVGLKANIRETVVMAGQPLGVVVDQQPRPKEDAPVFVDAGSSVELVVSVEAPAQPTALGAPDKVKVPADLVGLRFEEAREKLQDVNLGVKRVDDPAGNLPEGQVIRLEPAEGSEVPVLTEVQVVVSARILADGNDLG